jgi:hypothetical protein
MTTTDAAGPESIQDVIAKAVWEFDRENDEIDANVSAHALSIRIQAALESAGYDIRQRAGVVEISADVVRRYLDCRVDEAKEATADLISELVRATGDRET